MVQPPFESNNSIDRLVIEIAELVSAESRLSNDPLLQRTLRIQTIHSSLVIEGNTLTEEAVTAIINGKPVLAPPQDILEVENAHRAYNKLPKLDPHSVQALLQTHKIMMAGLVPDAGCFRSANVGVYDGEQLIHMGARPKVVPELIAELCAWAAATELHPVVASCIFHYEFEFIHPFSDGNGRLGRLWHTLLLSTWRPMLAWLPIESMIRERQAGYYAAIAESNTKGNSQPFVEFMLEVIRDTLRPFSEAACG